MRHARWRLSRRALSESDSENIVQECCFEVKHQRLLMMISVFCNAECDEIGSIKQKSLHAPRIPSFLRMSFIFLTVSL